MVTIQKAAPCSKGSVASITLENANGMRVTLLSYGATIQSILVPDKDGRMTDVLLGYDRAADYEVNSGYLGACIGRNGNRIAGAAFCLNGRRYTLTANEGKNQLHGGLCGFDKKIWSYTCREDSVEFTTVLADGEEGFPGRMEVAITFTLDDENGLHIDYRAVSDRDTVANFTNHAYFNLNGHGSGDILGHTLQLQASAFTPADEHTMPTGEITPGGLPGVETRGELLYTAGVAAGRITKEQMCALLSENPARLYGAYPRKGVIAPGSDADLVVYDPEADKTITAETQLSAAGYTPYEGWRTKGSIAQVYLRGTLAVDHGEMKAGPIGAYIPRHPGAL